MLTTSILFFCVHITDFGTGQDLDRIVCNGKEYALIEGFPMEIFFKKYPEKRPKRSIISSGLERGYVATLEVVGNQLYLKDIEIMVRDSYDEEPFRLGWKSVKNEIFLDSEPVKMDWISGLLVFTTEGPMWQSWGGREYDSSCGTFFVLEFVCGSLTREKQFTFEEYEKFKGKQFQAFKKTDEYLEIKEDLERRYNYPDYGVDNAIRYKIITHSKKILVEL